MKSAMLNTRPSEVGPTHRGQRVLHRSQQLPEHGVVGQVHHQL